MAKIPLSERVSSHARWPPHSPLASPLKLATRLSFLAPRHSNSPVPSGLTPRLWVVALPLPSARTPSPNFADVKSNIRIRGARQHNLKGIDLDIPRRAITVITGPVGLGQVVARLRHDLRRRPAPLRRIALGLRAPVPRADEEARRRLHRRTVAGGRDRTEEPDAHLAIHRRHRDGGLRLPAAALGAHRADALPGVRTRAEAGHRGGGRRRDARAPRGNARARRVSAEAIREGHARADRREPQREGLRARRRGRRRAPPRRAAAEDESGRRRRSCWSSPTGSPSRRERARGSPTRSRPPSSRATATPCAQ